MIITYMVGKGLDISLGFKTRYIDFYEYIKNSDMFKLKLKFKNDSDLRS